MWRLSLECNGIVFATCVRSVCFEFKRKKKKQDVCVKLLNSIYRNIIQTTVLPKAFVMRCIKISIIYHFMCINSQYVLVLPFACVHLSSIFYLSFSETKRNIFSIDRTYHLLRPPLYKQQICLSTSLLILLLTTTTTTQYCVILWNEKKNKPCIWRNLVLINKSMYKRRCVFISL